MRRVSLLVVMTLVAVACSGVSQEDHDVVLAEVDDLEEQVDELESKASDLESQLASAETQASEAEGQVAALEKDLAEAEADLATALSRFDEVSELSDIPSFPAAILASVFGRGSLRCGVAPSFAGFSETSGNTRIGFDADFCRAVAAAVLGDSEAVEFVPLTAGERFQAVLFGQVDVAFRITTNTLTRDAVFGQQVDFGPTTFYDGQRLMGSAARWDTDSTGADIGRARVCARPDPERAAVLTDYATEHGSQIEIIAIESLADAVADPDCDLIAGDGTFLAHLRATAEREGSVAAGSLVIFPEVPLTREPLTPMYNEGDTVWADVIDWVVYTTIIADEKGMTSSNIDSVEWDAEARRLFGGEGDLATRLALDPDAFYRVIKQVGSYSEIFQSNLGDLGYAQAGGLNQPASLGGLLYAPPAR